MGEMKVRVRVDKQGRLVIPATIRDMLDIRPGETVALTVDNGELKVRSTRAGVRRAQGLAAKYLNGRTGLVDEFIADRRREAAAE